MPESSVQIRRGLLVIVCCVPVGMVDIISPGAGLGGVGESLVPVSPCTLMGAGVVRREDDWESLLSPEGAPCTCSGWAHALLPARPGGGQPGSVAHLRQVRVRRCGDPLAGTPCGAPLVSLSGMWGEVPTILLPGVRCLLVVAMWARGSSTGPRARVRRLPSPGCLSLGQAAWVRCQLATGARVQEWGPCTGPLFRVPRWALCAAVLA